MITSHFRILTDDQLESLLKTKEAQDLLGQHSLRKSDLKVEQSWVLTFEQILLKMQLKYFEFASKNPDEKEKIKNSKSNMDKLREILNRMLALTERCEVLNSRVLKAESEALQWSFKCVELQKELDKQQLIDKL